MARAPADGPDAGIVRALPEQRVEHQRRAGGGERLIQRLHAGEPRGYPGQPALADKAIEPIDRQGGKSQRPNKFAAATQENPPAPGDAGCSGSRMPGMFAPTESDAECPCACAPVVPLLINAYIHAIAAIIAA